MGQLGAEGIETLLRATKSRRVQALLGHGIVSPGLEPEKEGKEFKKLTRKASQLQQVT